MRKKVDDNDLHYMWNKLKKSLVQVALPQSFKKSTDTDWTRAIQAAMDSSVEIYFPPGVYEISAPIVIPNHAHVWGVPNKSIIRAASNYARENFEGDDARGNFIRSNASAGRYMFQVIDSDITQSLGITDADQSNFYIEHITLDCNHLPRVGGLRLIRPYNACTVYNVIVTNTTDRAIFVGDKDGPSSLRDARSQTLLVDNCLFYGSKLAEPYSALGYFYDSNELNLQNTKFLFSSAVDKNYPCVILDTCTDAYIRGCSFAHTMGEAVRFTGYSRYFRLIANTYESIGTGNNNYDSSSSYPFTVRDYAISCIGSSGQNIQAGIIIETMYYNAPRKLLLQHTNDLFVIGSFSSLDDASVDNRGLFLVNSLTGGLTTDLVSINAINGNISMGTAGAAFTLKDANGLQNYLKAEADGHIHVRRYPAGDPDGEHDVLATIKDIEDSASSIAEYVISTSSEDEDPAPWTYYGSMSIGSGALAATVVSSSGPATVTLDGTTLYAYSFGADMVSVRVLYE